MDGVEQAAFGLTNLLSPLSSERETPTTVTIPANQRRGTALDGSCLMEHLPVFLTPSQTTFTLRSNTYIYATAQFTKYLRHDSLCAK